MPRGLYSWRTPLLVIALALSASAGAKPGFPVFGYLPGYATYGPYSADGVINLGDSAKFPWDRLTHVMEAFALPTYTGGLTWPYGQRANLVLRAHQNNTRAMLSIGGADLAGLDLEGKFRASTGPTYRAAFIATLTNTAATMNYDGIDIDWEFPRAGDRANFTQFMIELSAALKTQTSNCGGCVFQGQTKQLTFFGSPGADICGVDWDNVAFQNAVDYCIYGGYDFNAPPGYNSPTSTNWLQTDCRGIQYNFCLTQTVKTLTGVIGTDFSWPKEKLVLALPLYDKQNYQTFQGTPVLVALRQGTYLGFDIPQDEARYSLGGVTHYVNNAQSFCRKMSWARSIGLGGFALWEISHAYPANAPELTELWSHIGGTSACVNVPTPTPGPTPALLPPGMVDIGSSGTSSNLWGGVWGQYAGTGGSSISMNYTGAGRAASAYHATGPYAVCASGSLGTGAPSASTCLQPACAPYNLDSNGYTRVDFWFNATPGTYRLAFDRTATRATGHNHYGFDFEVAATGWNFYSFYLAASTQPGWGSPAPLAFNDVIAIVFQPSAGFASFNFCVDDLELVKQVVTPTPTPPAWLLDTVEDGNSTNNWGGNWSSWGPAPTTYNQSFNAPGYIFSPYGTLRAARLYGNHNSASELATLSTWLSSAQASSSVSLAAYNHLNFYFKGNGTHTQYSVGLERASGENWIFSFTMPATTEWVHIEVPLVQSSWGYSWGGTAGSWGLNNARRLYWYSTQAGPFDFSVDDIYFENRPPTPTPSRTPTFTYSATRTPSPTPSASPTPTPTPSATRTSTPSASPSATPSSSPTATPSGTATATPSVTATPSITVTSTEVPVGSSPTDTPTISPTFSATPTGTPSATLTSSPSSTATLTGSPTPSFSTTATPSVTGTFTEVPVGSSPTYSFTASPTPSATQTRTPAASVTSSHTPTAPASPTPDPGAPTFTPTPTSSPVVATPTFTATLVAVPATVAPSSGVLQILEGRAFPNPSPQSIRLRLDGPSDQVSIAIYTVARQLVGRVDASGPHAAGWVSLPLPAALRDSLGAGTYHFVAEASRGDVQALKPLVGSFVFLR